MSVLVAFGITLGTGLALALLWIFATSLRGTLQLRRAVAEAPSDAAHLVETDMAMTDGDDTT
jgi:hypothetical protein